MSLFRKDSDWKKITVALSDATDISVGAFTMATSLVDHFNIPNAYFASYTREAGFGTVAIQAETWAEAEAIEAFIRDNFADITSVEVKPMGVGSPAHAAAFAFARVLHGQGDKQIADVVHWTLNMLGYNYLAEAKLHCDLASHMIDNNEKTRTKYD